MRLDVDNLEFAAGFQTLIDKVSFGIRPGECVAILGPSGAGKSTLLKLLQGTYAHEGESVRYDGKPLNGDRQGLRAQLGYVPQDDIVHSSLTPGSELAYAARLRLTSHGDDFRLKRVREVLRLLELDQVTTTRIDRLSGGQRKRVSVGVELLAEPPVLYMDEPTSGLDPALEQKMMQLFATLARQGRVVMVTTHVMESLAEADLALVMMRGHMVFLGPPQSALNHFGAASFSRIYSKLEEKTPEQWKAKYRETPLFKKYVVERLAEPVSTATPAKDPGPAQAELTAQPGHAAQAADDPTPAPAKRTKQKRPAPAEIAEPEVAPPSPDADDELDAELAALKDEVRG